VKGQFGIDCGKFDGERDNLLINVTDYYTNLSHCIYQTIIKLILKAYYAIMFIVMMCDAL